MPICKYFDVYIHTHTQPHTLTRKLKSYFHLANQKEKINIFMTHKFIPMIYIYKDVRYADYMSTFGDMERLISVRRVRDSGICVMLKTMIEAGTFIMPKSK